MRRTNEKFSNSLLFVYFSSSSSSSSAVHHSDVVRALPLCRSFVIVFINMDDKINNKVNEVEKWQENGGEREKKREKYTHHRGISTGTDSLLGLEINQRKCRCSYMDWVNKHLFLRSVIQQNRYSIDIHIPPAFDRQHVKGRERERKAKRIHFD